MDSYKRNGSPFDTIAATFAERLDALVASWEVAIRADHVSATSGHDVVLREPAAILVDLERELSELERHCAEYRTVAELEQRDASEWEKRAMLSIEEGRDDLARQALVRRQQYATAWELADREAAALENLRDAFAQAVSAVRATVR